MRRRSSAFFREALIRSPAGPDGPFGSAEQIAETGQNVVDVVGIAGVQEPVAQAAHNIVAGDAERNAQQNGYKVQLYPVDLQQCADGDDGPHGKRRDAEQGDEADV